MLPWIAVPLGALGAWMVLRGNPAGWWFIAACVAMLALDLVIDIAWTRSAVARSDQPLLNRREAQYIGRKVCVTEPIAGGEGKVRVADTVWRARGPDCSAGTWVRIVATDSAYLIVILDETPPDSPSDGAAPR